MSVIFFGSLAGSPGVTTTALAVAMNWPRPTIVLEADISKASSILPGYLRGQLDHSLGLTPLSVTHQRGAITPEELWSQSIQIGVDRFVVPGFSNLSAAQAPTSLWGALGGLLAGLDEAGVDVVIDAGRLNLEDTRLALMQQADSVILLARPVLPDVAAVASRIGALRSTLAAVAHESHLAVGMVEAPYESYSAAEISRVVAAPVLPGISFDPRGAAVYSQGASEPSRFDRSPLRRSLATTIGAIRSGLHERAIALGPRPVTNQEQLS